MCLADPSGNPRPKRMIKMLQSLNIDVDVLSYPPSGDMNVNKNHYVSLPSKTFITRFMRFCVRLFLWFSPTHILKNWANNKYYGVSNLDKEFFIYDYDLIIVEDLQLLPIAFEIQNNAKIIFDAREYYPKQNEESWWFRLFEKHERTRLCVSYLFRCDVVLTVSPGLVNEYCNEFGIEAELVRSTPNYYEYTKKKQTTNKISIVYHGVANKNRKLENTINIFCLLDERFTLDLYLVGDKKYIDELKKLAKPHCKIKFPRPILFDELIPRLSNYDIGIFYAEPQTFNLKYCLPNKFFEFIQARLMVAIGPSPDMAELVAQYNCGIVSPSFQIEMMAEKLNELTADQLLNYKMNSNLAAKDLCFEQESIKLKKIFSSMLNV